MVGMKRSIDHVTNNAEDNLSVPPGFVSLTSLRLKKIGAGQDADVEGECEPKLAGGIYSKSDIKRFKTSLIQRPWLSHGQFECVQHEDDSEEIGVYMKGSVGARLPRGVNRGCAECDDCVKVIARWHPEDSYLPVLDDAPVFRPTEEEFKETLNYIAKIRSKAENYGMCRIIPPLSWIPPFLLKDKDTWEASKFSTCVQKIDGLQNQLSKSKRSRLEEKSETELPKDAASVELESRNEYTGDYKGAKTIDLVSEFEMGPVFTLKSFKKYADDFKLQYFRENDKVITTRQNQREPLIARVESEYWRIIENPSEEIEVLFGADLVNQTLASGFPVATSSAKDMDKYIKYVESGWNLNNTPGLCGSVLRFGCYNSSAISVPQIFIGMCFASQCWRNENHHLYSLSYSHTGSPKVWYCIPGKYCFKVVELVKKQFPQLSKHPKLLHELGAQLSPSMLMSEGIPVYRCVQNPLEFVVTFPGAYHSEFSCGFNCSEAVCFAPFDWLPHGQNIQEVYAGCCLKTSLSYDKLLFGAAMEGVAALWDSFANKTDSSETRLWRSVSGKGGILTRLLKLRVENEGTRRKHICNMMPDSRDHEWDAGTRRECSVCSFDLHLSAVSCSCSPHTYLCLRHVKKLCSCGWSAKRFFFRYSIAEMNLLVEALEGNLKAVHSWAKKKDPDSPRKNPKHVASWKSIAPAVDPASAGSNGCARGTNMIDRGTQNGVSPDENVVVVLSDDDD